MLKGKKTIYFLLSLIMLVALVGTATGIRAYLSDSEPSNTNGITAYTPNLWTQTAQADFNGGVLSNVDITTTPGSVMLSAPATTFSPGSIPAGNWTNPTNAYSSSNSPYATYTGANPVSVRSPTANNTGSWTSPNNAHATGAPGSATITSGSPSGSTIWGTYGYSLTGDIVTQVRVRADASSAGVAASSTQTVTADGDTTGTWAMAQTRTSTGNGTGGVGTWAASAGNMYDAVAETQMSGNDDTDYITASTDTGTNYQLFTFPVFTIPAGATITDVTVWERSSDVGAAGTNNIAGAITVGGTNYRAGSRNPPASTAPTWSNGAVWTTNPKGGGVWTVAEVNGGGTNPLQQFGVSSTDGNPDVLVYSCFVVVNYTVASNEYLNINETTADDTDMIVGTANGYELFSNAAFSIPTNATNISLTVNYRAADYGVTAAGTNVIRAAIKVNGTGYLTTDTGINPGLTWANYSYTFATDPAGGAWTPADINSGLQQIGVNGTDLAPDIAVSAIYAVVNYTAYDDQIKVEISWDGGVSNWSSQTATVTGSTPASYWFDFTSATNWTPLQVNDTNLKVRVSAVTVNSAELISLDWIPVEVTHYGAQVYGNYGVSISGTVTKVEVGIEAYAASSEKVRLEVSADNGVTWSARQTSSALTASDPNSTTWFDFTGAGWTTTQLDNSHLHVRISYLDNGAYGQVSLDWLPVRVTYRVSSGTVASQVLVNANNSTVWDGLAWDKTLPSGTAITFAVRASDTLFDKADASPAWSTPEKTTSPVISGLPAGKYMQWRATLTTGDTSTPTLQEVRTYYYAP